MAALAPLVCLPHTNSIEAGVASRGHETRQLINVHKIYKNMHLTYLQNVINTLFLTAVSLLYPKCPFMTEILPVVFLFSNGESHHCQSS